MLTGITPIDELFERVGERKRGIPSGSVVIIGQDEPDDAPRYILYNLIFNLIYKEDKYKIVYVITDKSFLKTIKEFNTKYIDKRKNFLKLLKELSEQSSNKKEKNSFIKIIDAQEINEESPKLSNIQALQESMYNENVIIIDYSCKETYSPEEDRQFQLKNNTGYQAVSNITGLRDLINYIHKDVKDKKKELVVIYNNSSRLFNHVVDSFENEIFFDLFHSKSDKMTIFHFFTLGLFNNEEKNRLIDNADGFIHLRCERDKTCRPLRSVGICKMKGVMHSSVYNAYRVDDYGIVRLLK